MAIRFYGERNSSKLRNLISHLGVKQRTPWYRVSLFRPGGGASEIIGSRKTLGIIRAIILGGVFRFVYGITENISETPPEPYTF